MNEGASSASSPRVTCIVPVFNGERYLAEALDSIFAQTHRPLEVLVVDDGSTDGTAEVAGRYGDRLTCLTQPNAGHAAARNRGVHASRGELLAFLDADDLWHPEKLERQMDRFRARPELEYCVTQLRNFWISELAGERLRRRRYGEALPGYSTVTLLVTRALFERIGPFDPRLRHGDDTEWLLRATDRGAIEELLPEVLLYRRIHHTNRSRQFAAESLDEYLRILKGRLDARRRDVAAR